MDRSYVAGNKAVRERLGATIVKLTDEDLNKPLGGGWTVKAALAHLAHWDRARLSQLEEWERIGAPNVQFLQYNADPINEAMLPQWLATPAGEVLREVVDASEAVDSRLENLPDDLLALLLEKQPGVPIRSRHRGAHLDDIDKVLGR